MNKTIKLYITKALLALPLLLVALASVMPFIVLLSSSFTANDIVREQVQIIPKGFTLDAYKILFRFPEEILKSYGLTIFVTFCGVFLNVVLCSMIAYALSDNEFRWRKSISFFVFFTMLFQTGLIPQYIIITRVFNLNNTPFILILMPLLHASHILFLRVYYQGLPKSLFEAARIDGANEFFILFRIAMPLIKPGLVTLVFQFILLYWNDAFTPLYFADDLTPIALYLQRWRTYVEQLKMIGQSGLGGILGPNAEIPDSTVQFALGVVTTIPLAIIFAFLQKHFIRGLTAGGVKG